MGQLMRVGWERVMVEDSGRPSSPNVNLGDVLETMGELKWLYGGRGQAKFVLLFG